MAKRGGSKMDSESSGETRTSQTTRNSTIVSWSCLLKTWMTPGSAETISSTPMITWTVCLHNREIS